MISRNFCSVRPSEARSIIGDIVKTTVIALHTPNQHRNPEWKGDLDIRGQPSRLRAMMWPNDMQPSPPPSLSYYVTSHGAASEWVCLALEAQIKAPASTREK